MLRHRRRTVQQRNHQYDESDDLSSLKELFERNRRQKELKTEIRFLRLENKLNQQIRRYIDKRLIQLNKQPRSEKKI